MGNNGNVGLGNYGGVHKGAGWRRGNENGRVHPSSSYSSQQYRWAVDGRLKIAKCRCGAILQPSGNGFKGPLHQFALSRSGLRRAHRLTSLGTCHRT